MGDNMPAATLPVTTKFPKKKNRIGGLPDEESSANLEQPEHAPMPNKVIKQIAAKQKSKRTVGYTTKFEPAFIEAVKHFAIDHRMKVVEVFEEAFAVYKKTKTK